jgi:hypothetical protein
MPVVPVKTWSDVDPRPRAVIPIRVAVRVWVTVRNREPQADPNGHPSIRTWGGRKRKAADCQCNYKKLPPVHLFYLPSYFISLII